MLDPHPARNGPVAYDSASNGPIGQLVDRAYLTFQAEAASIQKLLRRYLGTQGRDVRLERDLADELDRSSQALDRALLAASSSPSRIRSKRSVSSPAASPTTSTISSR